MPLRMWNLYRSHSWWERLRASCPGLGGFSVYLHSWKGIAACIVVFAAALILWKTAEKVKLKESKK